MARDLQFDTGGQWMVGKTPDQFGRGRGIAGGRRSGGRKRDFRCDRCAFALDAAGSEWLEDFERRLIAGDHVLSDALQAQDSIGYQGNTPKFEMMLTQDVGCGHRDDTFPRCNSVGTGYRRMPSVEIGRFSLHIADVRFPSQPILPRKQRSKGIGKGAAAGNDSQGYKLLVDQSVRAFSGRGCGRQGRGRGECWASF
jgi:hypothetical protein